MRDLCAGILIIPFVFSCFVGVLLGGNALFYDAECDYELYQVGHYYLASHGEWTEVTYGQYRFVLISEIIGFSSFAVAFVFALLVNANKIFPRRSNPEKQKKD